MRWFVEVSSLTPGAPTHRLTVEAATWQGALAQGRSNARDTAPLSNFTIEVLPDGYRATNGVARTRYVVSKAPDDAALTNEPVVVDRKPSVPPPDSKSPAATAASALGRRSKPPGAPRPETTPAPTAAKPIVEAAPIERGKIILRKAEGPGAKSPLTYRELAIALPPGAPSQLAMAVARANLDDVRAELDRENAPAGRLVQLAVFDHEWQGRPERPPLIALTWKDWRGNDPEIKGSAAAAQPVPAAAPAPAPVAKPIDARSVASEINSAVEAARPPKPTPSSPDIPAAVEAIVSPSTSVAVARPAPAPAPAVAPVPAPAPAAPISAPVADPFASAPESAPRSSRPDDLMSEIFESMHDIHFMKDALDGADFVLELLREKIPTSLALVHFYDINSKEFVVVKARTPNGTSVSGKMREGTGLVGAALASGKPVVVRDAASDDRWSREAYAQGGHTAPREIVVLPMRHHGRFLGAIELADHVDGEAFGDNEIHAVSYVAEQFAEFVQDRGVLISRGADSTGSFQVIEPQRRR